MKNLPTQFSAEFFAGNRKRLRELFAGSAPIVLTANGLVQRNADSSYPFRQDSSFWYLTGIDEPDVVLVMDKSKEYLIVPARSDSRTIFDGSVDKAQLRLVSGIDLVVEEKPGWKQLGTRLSRVKHVATLSPPPAYVDVYGLYSNPARGRLASRLKEANASLELLDLRSHLARMRSVKQPIELDAISSAVALTIKTLSKVEKQLPRYKLEREIMADITKEFLKAGADHAYQPIVAGGKNACTLHYISNTSRLGKGEGILIDTGAEINHYAADITRTFYASDMTKRQRLINEAVKSIQEYAKSLLKPGRKLKDYEKQVFDMAGEKLRELGLIKSITQESVRIYYPHATSHFLGLDVHDVGNYDKTIEAGMVLTVEPGIYIPEEGIGVRIEDDIVITTDGHAVLGKYF